MLISKQNILSGDIASFKLNNGDELVARIKEVSSDTYVLSKPCVVVPSQQGIGLMQAMFTVDPEKTIELNRAHVMMTAPTIEAIQNHYIKTTTGIEPVTRGGIIA
jgi:hypothetical protein